MGKGWEQVPIGISSDLIINYLCWLNVKINFSLKYSRISKHKKRQNDFVTNVFGITEKTLINVKPLPHTQFRSFRNQKYFMVCKLVFLEPNCRPNFQVLINQLYYHKEYYKWAINTGLI